MKKYFSIIILLIMSIPIFGQELFKITGNPILVDSTHLKPIIKLSEGSTVIILSKPYYDIGGINQDCYYTKINFEGFVGFVMTKYLSSFEAYDLVRNKIYKQADSLRKADSLSKADRNRVELNYEQDMIRLEQDRVRLEQDRIKRIKHLYGSYAKIIIDNKIQLGMSKKMVEESWGLPEDINRSVYTWTIKEQWVYPGHTEYNHTYLYFDDGILTSWQD